MALYLGIEIGGTKLQLITGDETWQILKRWKLAVEAGRGAAGIRHQIERTLEEIREPVAAVGAGFGGPVDWKSGRICRSHQIEGWSEFDLGGWLHKLTGVPVFIDNDANLGALGEATRGAGVGFNPVCYVTLGSGVGGGLVVDGKVYHGAKPGETAIGHLLLDRNGTIVEARCSGWAVDARIRALKSSAPASALAKMIGNSAGGEARYLPAALVKNDPEARRILSETAEDLAFGLSHVAHLFHPEIIVLGGGLALMGEPLSAAVHEALKQFVMPAFAPGPRVCAASLGEDAIPTGALVLARSGAS